MFKQSSFLVILRPYTKKLEGLVAMGTTYARKLDGLLSPPIPVTTIRVTTVPVTLHLLPLYLLPPPMASPNQHQPEPTRPDQTKRPNQTYQEVPQNLIKQICLNQISHGGNAKRKCITQMRHAKRKRNTQTQMQNTTRERNTLIHNATTKRKRNTQHANVNATNTQLQHTKAKRKRK